VVTTFLSPLLVAPELYVVAMEDEHGSEYHGIKPFSDTELILNVYIEVV
jgi:hypothetical protein